MRFNIGSDRDSDVEMKDLTAEVLKMPDCSPINAPFCGNTTFRRRWTLDSNGYVRTSIQTLIKEAKPEVVRQDELEVFPKLIKGLKPKKPQDTR